MTLLCHAIQYSPRFKAHLSKKSLNVPLDREACRCSGRCLTCEAFAGWSAANLTRNLMHLIYSFVMGGCWRRFVLGDIKHIASETQRRCHVNLPIFLH